MTTTLNDVTRYAQQQATTSSAVISLDQLLNGIGGMRGLPPTRDNIAVGLYGGSGCGKSTDLDCGFQDALIVKHSPTVTLPYYSLITLQDPEAFARGRHDWMVVNAAWSAHPAFDAYADYLGGLKAVELTTGWKSLLAEFDIPAGASMYVTLEQIRYNFQLAYHQGYKLPVTGVVIDEFTEALRVIYNEFKIWFPPAKYTGTIFDEVPAMNAHEKWLREYIASFRSMGLLFGAVCQEAALAYDDDKKSHFYGRIKYKMGPRTPFGRERSIITEAMDIMWRLYLEKGSMMIAPLPTLVPDGAPSPGAIPALSVPALPGAPGAAGSPPVPSAGSSLVVPAGPSVVLPDNKGSRVWPIPIKPIKTYSPRFYWTEATDEIEAKTRNFTLNHREAIGFRDKLVRMGHLSS